jgi:hypothetical protein
MASATVDSELIEEVNVSKSLSLSNGILNTIFVEPCRLRQMQKNTNRKKTHQLEPNVYKNF